jgi:hypothetical protein
VDAIRCALASPDGKAINNMPLQRLFNLSLYVDELNARFDLNLVGYTSDTGELSNAVFRSLALILPLHGSTQRPAHPGAISDHS